VLRFEVAAETFALFRDAMSQLRRRSDHRVDDDALLLEMARAVLGGPRDEGRSSYQVSLTVCSECGRGAQLASGELVQVGSEVVELAQCDSQQLGPIMPAANEASEADAHVGASSNARNARSAVRAHAKQTIPPAVRRAVLQRDRRRCRVPGCRNATFLDVHHIVPRAEGGCNDAMNLLTLCGAHHRAIHRGELIVERNAEGTDFQHADGTRYGESLAPQVADVFSKVATALRHLGFREADVRCALAKLRQQANTRMAPAELLLREALLWLTPARAP
jgi:hypothetical protein